MANDFKITTNNLGEIPESHNLIFTDSRAAQDRDLSQAIGRTDGVKVQLLDDKHGKKARALLAAGAELSIEKDTRNNWYLTDSEATKVITSDANDVDMAVIKNKLRPQIVIPDEPSVNESETEKVDYQKLYDERTDYTDNDSLTYLNQIEFLKYYSDDAIDLMFSTDDMIHEHQVGLLSMNENVYTLRDDIDFIDSFELELDESDGVIAYIDNDSMKVSELRKLTEMMMLEDEEDKEPEQNTTESDADAKAAKKAPIEPIKGTKEEAKKTEKAVTESMSVSVNESKQAYLERMLGTTRVKTISDDELIRQAVHRPETKSVSNDFVNQCVQSMSYKANGGL
ncbi:hypothetical protein ACSTIN_12905 [Vibrio parahaemolyticus]